MDQLSKAVETAHEALAGGSPEDAVIGQLPDAVASEAIELARARFDARDRFDHADELFFDAAGLRYATPEVVADHRARRLAGSADRVADVACGVGIQLAYIARHADEAVGVERDARRAGYARRNLDALGATAEVIEADALDPATVERVGPVDAVFCDPARAPGEPERTLDGLDPDPRRVLTAYDVGAVAFELPPQMPPGRIHGDLDGEVEYTSLEFELNRACLWMGPLAEADRAAVSLPSGERLTSDHPADDVDPTDPADGPGPYVYEVDPALRQAGLVPQLSAAVGGIDLLHDDGRRCLATGPRALDSPWCRTHDVLDVVRGPLSALPDRLRRANAGSVTLRFSVDPSEYWDVRNRLEKDLDGPDRVHLFRIEDSVWVITSERP